MHEKRKPATGCARNMVLFLDRRILWLSNHWLALFNTLAGIYAGLPVLAPVLASMGLQWPAVGTYSVYQFLCHQRPERSFFVLGHQMAFCQRDLAIYAAIFAAGLLYAATRRCWRPLPWWGGVLLLLPAVVDGSLQLMVAYESTWLLRLATGIPAGVAAVWFLYPRLDAAFRDIGARVARQLERAALRDRGLL